MTVDTAAAFLIEHGHPSASDPAHAAGVVISDPQQRERIYRQATKRLHPDVGGDAEMFKRLDLSDLRVLTLWQPWASLWADPELPKTIESRPKPWPSTIPLPAWVLIGAAAKRPEPWSKVGDYRIVPVNHRRGWYLSRQMDGAEIGQRPLWLSAVIGAAHVTACLPILNGADSTPIRDGADAHPGCRGLWLTPIRHPGARHRLLLDDNLGGNDPDELTDLTAELPYGDFTPGRWGYLTDRTVLFPEPIRWKGAQGFQRATPELIEQVTPWLT